MSAKLSIKKGDKVILIAGKDKGKKGEVIQVFPALNKVRVSGLNIAKRHTKPSNAGAGGIVEKEMPIHVSNVSHVDPKTSAPTKIGAKTLKDGKKVRFAKKSGEVIDN
jgi:large subunit ribosomal protein L24